MLRALAERRIGRRDQATAWIRRLAEYTREVHEEYATQRWPETKRLLGLLVNSAGSAHGRNARRLAHAARKQDRRLAAALLAAALALTHSPEAEEALRGAWTRMARKPTSLARDLLRIFPRRRTRGSRRKRRGQGAAQNGDGQRAEVTAASAARTRRRATAQEKQNGESGSPLDALLGSSNGAEPKDPSTTAGAQLEMPEATTSPHHGGGRSADDDSDVPDGAGVASRGEHEQDPE